MRLHRAAVRAGTRSGKGWHARPGLAALLFCLAVASPATAATGSGEPGGSKGSQSLPGNPRATPPANAGRACTPGGRVALRPADATTTPPLAPGQPVCLRLQRGQTAFFRVAPSAGGHYTLSTRQLALGTDTVLGLLDADGRPVAEDDDGGEQELASRLEVSPELGGTLVRAGTLGDVGGSFELVLVRDPPQPPPEFATRPEQAAGRPPLAEGQTLHLRLRRHQAAYFALPAERAQLFAATRNLRGSTDTVLALLDASGAVLAENDDNGNDLASMLALEDLAGGATLLRVSTLGGDAGEFDLVVARNAATPAFPTTLAAARERGPLGAGVTLPMELAPGQTAVFALPGDQDVIMLTRNLRGDTDTILALLDANGRVIAEDDDGGGGLASRLPTTRAARRPAFLRVQTLSNTGGTFDLAVLGTGGQQGLQPAPAAGTPGTPAGTVAEAVARPTLVPGEPVALRLVAGQAAVFGLPNDGRPAQGVTFPLDETRADIVLELLDAEGQVLAQNGDAGNGPSPILALPAQPRPAFLRARVVGDQDGAFQLVLVRVAP